jgi:hypothetical protein
MQIKTLTKRLITLNFCVPNGVKRQRTSG